MSSVWKNANESGELHQDKARFYQLKHCPLLGKSQQQQQQASNIHQHQAIFKTNRKYHEQQLSTSAIDFQIQRKHSFISSKNSVRRELRNLKESVSFESKNTALMNLQLKMSFPVSQKRPISVKISQRYKISSPW